MCAFIDAEHAMDPLYARNLGVDIDELLVSQPDYGEQGLEIADMLVRSGAVDVVAIDSVAALTPRAELEGQMGDQTVGVQARMMSQAMRKLAGNLNRTQTLCLFVNQIREKVGVMFGCFHYDARVVLADGRTEKIGKIVNQRMPVEVMSMDPETGKDRAAPDRRVLRQRRDRRVPAVRGGRRGWVAQAQVRVHSQPPHLHARRGEARVRDRGRRRGAVAAKQYALSDDQIKLILGSLLGDGSLRYASVHNAAFRVGHGERQRDYVEWKHAMLAPFAHASIAPTGNGIGSTRSPCASSPCSGTRCTRPRAARPSPTSSSAQLDERAIAAWYCDDGTFGELQALGSRQADDLLRRAQPSETASASRIGARSWASAGRR